MLLNDSNELQRRLDQDSRLSQISVLALDPGAMPTGIVRRSDSWFLRVVLFGILVPAIATLWDWASPNGTFRTLGKSARDVVAAAFACGPPPLTEWPKGVFLNGSAVGEYNSQAKDPLKRDVVWKGSVRYAKLKEGETLLENWS